MFQWPTQLIKCIIINKNMHIMYKDSKWLSNQAKTLERKILNAKKSGPSYSTIERMLSKGVDYKANAIIELRDCDDKGCVVVLNEGQYKINKQDVINNYGRTTNHQNLQTSKC